MTILTRNHVIKFLRSLTVEDRESLLREVTPPCVCGTAAGIPHACMGPPSDEQTEFAVYLMNYGPYRLQAVKLVREVTKLGLVEAALFVDNLPAAVDVGVSKQAAEYMRNRFSQIGATVEVR